MNQTPDRNERATKQAARELGELQRQAEQARAVLARLQQDVVDAEQRLGSNEAAQLLEANERLVLATLRAQTEAEAAARE